MTDRRQAARDAVKDRPVRRGLYAVRCTATGGTWVGASPNLDAARNGAWFALRTGAHRDRGLQASWQAHGEAAHVFETLETLDDDVHPTRVHDLLKLGREAWVARLGAGLLL